MASGQDIPEALFARAVVATDEVRQARELLQHKAAERRQAILALREAGASYGQIAEQLGCSRSAVQSILRRTEA
ncbi:helix-turn-helix domain-containing protein [Mycobacterium sp.]|uniref:helix-turn-helix domain-containing protein n=1 Tax=Mycobacterium sp. TaxID=1785 RepID=UPI003D6BF43B